MDTFRALIVLAIAITLAGCGAVGGPTYAETLAIYNAEKQALDALKREREGLEVKRIDLERTIQEAMVAIILNGKKFEGSEAETLAKEAITSLATEIGRTDARIEFQQKRVNAAEADKEAAAKREGR